MDPNSNQVNPNDTIDGNTGSIAPTDPVDADFENIANEVASNANNEPPVQNYETPTPDESVNLQPTGTTYENSTNPQAESLYEPADYSQEIAGTNLDETVNVGANVTEPQYTQEDLNPSEYAQPEPNEAPLPDYQPIGSYTTDNDQYAPTSEMPVNDTATDEDVMQEFSTPEDNGVTPLDPSPLSPPEKPSGKHTAIIPLVIITLLLFALLLGSIWFFFLRGDGEGPQPTPTPSRTPTAIPTQGSTDTHLECRFGLCVEVPGAGEDKCSSSFDCEQATLSPTVPPITTPSIAPTVAPTSVTPAATITATPPTATPTTTAPTGITPTTNPTTLPSAPPTLRPTTPPTPSPTPIAGSLPDSGTAEMTLLFSGLFVLALGAGFVLLRKQ